MTESSSNPEPQTMDDYMANNSWRPSAEEGAYPSIEEIVGQAVGAGSTCWEKLQAAGTFDSTTARWITEGAIASIKRTLQMDDARPYPYQSGDHTIIGPECFSNEEETIISWKGQNYRLVPDHAETLVQLQENAEKHLEIYTVAWRDTLFEHMTRAFNAGYQTAQEDGRRQAGAADYERDQEVRRQEYDKGVGPTKCGMAEESAESRRMSLQRRQDQADLIDLILTYRNPASEETRMRQIRVVMD